DVELFGSQVPIERSGRQLLAAENLAQQPSPVDHLLCPSGQFMLLIVGVGQNERAVRAAINGKDVRPIVNVDGLLRSLRPAPSLLEAVRARDDNLRPRQR